MVSLHGFCKAFRFLFFHAQASDGRSPEPSEICMSTPHAVRYLDEAQVLSLLDPDRLSEGVRDALI